VTSSFDTDGEIISGLITIEEDGTEYVLTDLLQEVEHTFTSGGNKYIRLKVTDNDGLSAETRDLVEVMENQAPVADFECDGSVVGTLSCRSLASDFDGTIVSHLWEVLGNTTTETEWSFSGFTETSVDVKLTVTDNLGANTSKVQTINITQNILPIASGNCTSTTPWNIRCESTSRDSDGNIQNTIWKLGETEKQGEYVGFDVQSNDSVSITLTVVDNLGGENTKVFTITPTPNSSPEILISTPNKIFANQVVKLDASSSSDDNSSNLNYNWEIEGETKKRAGKLIYHQFQSAGSFNLKLTVFDEYGAQSIEEINVEVLPAEESLLISSVGLPASIIVNEDFSLNINMINQLPVLKEFKIDVISGPGNIEFITSSSGAAKFRASQIGEYSAELIVSNEVYDAKYPISISVLSSSTEQTFPKPIAKVNRPLGLAHSAVILDGSYSTDADDMITVYEWYLNEQLISMEKYVEISLTEKGQNTLTLRIQDEAGQTAETTVFTNYEDLRYSFSHPNGLHNQEIGFIYFENLIAAEGEGEIQTGSPDIENTWKKSDDRNIYFLFLPRENVSSEIYKFIVSGEELSIHIPILLDIDYSNPIQVISDYVNKVTQSLLELPNSENYVTEYQANQVKLLVNEKVNELSEKALEAMAFHYGRQLKHIENGSITHIKRVRNFSILDIFPKANAANHSLDDDPLELPYELNLNELKELMSSCKKSMIVKDSDRVLLSNFYVTTSSYINFVIELSGFFTKGVSDIYDFLSNPPDPSVADAISIVDYIAFQKKMINFKSRLDNCIDRPFFYDLGDGPVEGGYDKQFVQIDFFPDISPIIHTTDYISSSNELNFYFYGFSYRAAEYHQEKLLTTSGLYPQISSVVRAYNKIDRQMIRHNPILSIYYEDFMKEFPPYEPLTSNGYAGIININDTASISVKTPQGKSEVADEGISVNLRPADSAPHLLRLDVKKENAICKLDQLNFTFKIIDSAGNIQESVQRHGKNLLTLSFLPPYIPINYLSLNPVNPIIREIFYEKDQDMEPGTPFKFVIDTDETKSDYFDYKTYEVTVTAPSGSKNIIKDKKIFDFTPTEIGIYNFKLSLENHCELKSEETWSLSSSCKNGKVLLNGSCSCNDDSLWSDVTNQCVYCPGGTLYPDGTCDYPLATATAKATHAGTIWGGDQTVTNLEQSCQDANNSTSPYTGFTFLTECSVEIFCDGDFERRASVTGPTISCQLEEGQWVFETGPAVNGSRSACENPEGEKSVAQYTCSL
jgi:hypothetical protein